MSFLVQRLAHSSSTDVVIGRAQVVKLDSKFVETASEQETDAVFPYYIGSAVYRRQAFSKVGAFDERMRFGEDTDWFQRAREAGLEIERVENTTLTVQRHDANMTRGKTVVELQALRVLKNALDRRRARAVGPAAPA